jgi:hypothetical protein
LAKNEDLNGYAVFVAKLQGYKESGMTLEDAMRRAVEECIAEGILVEILTKYKIEELVGMFSLYYDEEMAREVAREEGREEGREELLIELIELMLRKGESAESIAWRTDIDIERIISIKENMLVVV